MISLPTAQGAVRCLKTFLICLIVIAIIWLIGQIAYQMEVRWQRDRDKRKRNGVHGKQFCQNAKDRKHSKGLGKGGRR